MNSLRGHEGELELDHRDSPGIPGQMMVAHGLPPDAGQGVFRCATFTCSHCQVMVAVNPKRNRERYYCRGCDHLLCDACGILRANGEPCITMNQKIEAFLEATVRAEQAGLSSPSGILVVSR